MKSQAARQIPIDPPCKSRNGVTEGSPGPTDGIWDAGTASGEKANGDWHKDSSGVFFKTYQFLPV